MKPRNSRQLAKDPRLHLIPPQLLLHEVANDQSTVKIDEDTRRFKIQRGDAFRSLNALVLFVLLPKSKKKKA